MHYTKRAISFSPRRRRRFPKGKKKKSPVRSSVCVQRGSLLSLAFGSCMCFVQVSGVEVTHSSKKMCKGGGRKEERAAMKLTQADGRTDGRPGSRKKMEGEE